MLRIHRVYLLGIVCNTFGDQLTVLIVILNTLIQNSNFNSSDAELMLLLRRVDRPGTRPRTRLRRSRRIYRRVNGRITTVINDDNRIAIEIWISKQTASISEIHNGEILFAVIGFQACAASDDLLELGHRVDVVVQYNQPAGLAVNASGHQFRCGNNDRIRAVFGNEIVKLCLAFSIITCNAHDILRILSHHILILVH